MEYFLRNIDFLWALAIGTSGGFEAFSLSSYFCGWTGVFYWIPVAIAVPLIQLGFRRPWQLLTLGVFMTISMIYSDVYGKFIVDYLSEKTLSAYNGEFSEVETIDRDKLVKISTNLRGHGDLHAICRSSLIVKYGSNAKGRCEFYISNNGRIGSHSHKDGMENLQPCKVSIFNYSTSFFGSCPQK